MKARDFTTGLLCAVSACLANATEFGAMVLPGLPEPHLRDLTAGSGISWLRTAGRYPVPAGLRDVTVIYPGARKGRFQASAGIHEQEYPQDLQIVFRAARDAVRASTAGIRDWEIGNEPDFLFSRDLPHHVAAAVKAACLGLRAGGATGRILMPSLARRPGPYAGQLVASGLGGFGDGWNMHFYSWAQDFSGNIAEHRRLLSAHGLPPVPMWITEAGYVEMNGDGSRPSAVLLGRQAAYFERIALEAWSEGVEGFAAFTMAPFAVGGNDYGLMDRDLSPRPALERYLHLTRELPRCRPLYRLRGRGARDGVGIVILRPDGRWWTVLWTSQRRAENDLPGSIDGAVPAAVTSLETFHLRIPSGAQFGASPGALGSAVVASRDLGFTASAATNLHVLAPAGRFDIRGVQWLPWTPPPKSTPSAGPGPVVVQIRPVPGTTPDRDGLTYRFQPDRTPTLELVAYNFSDAETAGVLEFHGPQDWITEGPVSEHLRLAPGMAHVRRLSLLPGAKVHSQDRYPVSLEWTPESGRGDSLRAFVAPSSSAAEVVGTVPWRPQWEADPPGTSWRLAGEDLPLRLELSASPAGEIPGLVTPLPEHVVLRGDDVIRIRARTVSGLCASGLRLELVTPARVVTYGVHDGVIGAEVVEADFRVADLEPAFWSRADPERRWRPEQIRYLRLQFGGLARGSIVEVGTPQIRRRPR